MTKIKVLFKMFYLYHKAAFDPLINLFENDSKYDVALSLTHEVERTFRVFDRDETKKYLKQFISEGHRITDENEEFDIVIVPDVVDETKYGDALLCLIYHGIIFTKTVTHRELKRHSNYSYIIFVEGERSIKTLNDNNSIGNSKIFKVGYPKMDPYFSRKKFNREDILQSLGLDINKPVILFAPTYKPTCLFDLKDEIFEATRDYNLIIKLHHYSWMGKYASHSHHRIFENRIDNYNHAIIIQKDDYNILPLLYIADTLVSEASGSITEFLATGKTGIIYDLDPKNLKHSDGETLLGFDNHKYLKDAFVHIDHPSQLKGAIAKALNPDDRMIQSQHIERENIFYKLDGNASARVKRYIENLVNKT